MLAGFFVTGSLAEWSALAGDAPLRWRTPEEWRILVRASGLGVVRDGSERRVLHYPSAGSFLRSLHGTGAAPLRRLAPAKLRRLLQEYEGRHRTDAEVPASWEFYRFEAVGGEEKGPDQA